MPVLKYEGGKVELDDDGFLVDFEEWNENVARAIAKKEGLTEFSDDMIAVIRFMLSYYKEFKFFPVLNAVCKNVHQPRDCVTEEFIDPMKAWKIAGLPNLEVVSTASFDEKGNFAGFNVPT